MVGGHLFFLQDKIGLLDKIGQKKIMSYLISLLFFLWAFSSPAFASEAGFWQEAAFQDIPLRGPSAAVGVVLYNHGTDLHNEQHKLIPPPYIRLLAQGGWDVVKLARPRAVDKVQRAENAVVSEIKLLQRRGYRRIILAGPSRGGWLGLMAATREPVFAVIAAAPGGYGVEGNGIQRSLNEMKARLPHIKPGTRVMIFDFKGDPRSDKVGGRGGLFRQLLAPFPSVIIDRPAGFTGHTSSMNGRFARVYGACIRRFVEPSPLPAGFSCNTTSGAAVGDDLPLPPQLGLKERWFGIFPNGDARMIVITQRENKTAEIVLSWGTGAVGKPQRKAGWVRLKCTREAETTSCPRAGGKATLRSGEKGKLAYVWRETRTQKESLLVLERLP